MKTRTNGRTEGEKTDVRGDLEELTEVVISTLVLRLRLHDFHLEEAVALKVGMLERDVHYDNSHKSFAIRLCVLC